MVLVVSPVLLLLPWPDEFHFGAIDPSDNQRNVDEAGATDGTLRVGRGRTWSRAKGQRRE